ncbi:MAG: hypothetical protein K2J74_07145, partial [Muribaculaceae bacterium]|nr:hypothetical protein [Muribaculaceae bacterium]
MNIRSLMSHELFVSKAEAHRHQNPGIQGIPRSVLNDERLRPHLTAEQINHLRERHDFPYWCQRRLDITDKATNRNIRFELNAPQIRFIAQCETLRLTGKPIHVIALKSRQWGCTTVVNAYMLWLLIYHHENSNLALCGNSHTIVGNTLNTFR